MTYVGAATSLGLVVEVPIVLRSLCASIGAAGLDELPMEYDAELIALLDSGTNSNQFGRIVKSYKLAWWKGTRCPVSDGILNAETIGVCLEHHRAMLLESMAGELMPEHPINPLPALQLPSGTEGPIGAESSIYHSLAGDLLNEVKSIKAFTSGMSESTSNDTDVITRRAAGFYMLHEKALLKELQSDPAPIHDKAGLHGTKKGKMSQRVALNAQEQLQRIQLMPPGSYKWTWGETLTTEDVLGLRHISKQRIRSGYDTTLRGGKLSGMWSETAVAPTGTARYSLPADEPLGLPPSSFLYPEKFEKYNMNPSLPNTVAKRSAENEGGAEPSVAVTSPPFPPSRRLALARRWAEKSSDDSADAEPTVSLSPHSRRLALATKWAEKESDDEADAEPTVAVASISPHSRRLALATKWAEKESDDEADAEPTVAVASLSPHSRRLALATKWAEKESDDEAGAQSTAILTSHPSPSARRLALAQKWAALPSDEDADPEPSATVTPAPFTPAYRLDLAKKSTDEESDLNAGAEANVAALPISIAARRLALTKKWASQESDDDSPMSKTGSGPFFPRLAVAQRWLDMESDNDIPPRSTPRKLAIAHKWLSDGSGDEVSDGPGAGLGDDDGADCTGPDSPTEPANSEDGDSGDNYGAEGEDEEGRGSRDTSDVADDEDGDTADSQDDEDPRSSSYGPELIARPSRINLSPPVYSSADFAAMMPLDWFGVQHLDADLAIESLVELSEEDD